MEKELTNKGIREEELDLPTRIPIEKKEKKKFGLFKKKNSDTEESTEKDYPKNYKMKKTNKIILISAISILVIFFLANIFWFNLSVQNNKLKQDQPINNNVNTPVNVNTTTNIPNNFTIQNNIQINIPDAIAQQILDAIKNDSKINITSNCTTNCT